MKTWLHINEQKPEEGQLVWYYFGHFDKVYPGKYTLRQEFMDGVLIFEADCFYGKRGFLGDDVTWWMPRVEGEPEPEHPTREQKYADIYHPLREV